MGKLTIRIGRFTFCSLSFQSGLITLWTALLFPSPAAALEPQDRTTDHLKIKYITPLPNYDKYADLVFFEPLTDRRVEANPIWGSRRSYGWQETSSIAFSLELSNQKGRTNDGTHSGTLSFHTGRGLYAEVDIPYQVAIYGKDIKGGLTRVAVSYFESNRFDDKHDHWLRMKIINAPKELVVIIHPRKKYLFVDEISWSASKSARHEDSRPHFAEFERALRDSADILVNTLSGQNTVGNNDILKRSRKDMVIWFEDPWSDGLPHFSYSSRNTDGRQMLLGYAGEHETLLIGLMVGEEQKLIDLQITGIPQSAWTLRQLKPVMSADGDLMYDVLDNLAAIREISVVPGRVIYLWVDVDLGGLTLGLTYGEIQVSTDRTKETLQFSVEVRRPPENSEKENLRINVWAYLTDLPIFSSEDDAISDLISGGVNVWVANPLSLPGANLEGHADLAAMKRLRQLAKLTRKSDGTLLLYPGWLPSSNPLNINPINHQIGSAKALLDWIDQISRILEQEGLGSDQWALYPFDEPDGNGLNAVRVLGKFLQEHSRDILLYANPSIDGGGDISVRDLKVANEFVDIWQPHLGLVEYVGAGTFGKFAKPWWFYSNPESPTKSASPLGDYRGLFWIAWNLGASGLGFWSYSDTSGSSAWNDFDGRRPDWAVVYESNTAPISSRRWAAFKEGREDYALLQSLTGQSRDRLQKMVSSRDVTTWTSNDYARARRAAFDAANSGKNPR